MNLTEFLDQYIETETVPRAQKERLEAMIRTIERMAINGTYINGYKRWGWAVKDHYNYEDYIKNLRSLYK